MTTKATASDRETLASPDGFPEATASSPPIEPDEPTPQASQEAHEAASRVWESIGRNAGPLLNVLRQPQWLALIVPFLILFAYATVWLCRKEWFYLGSPLLFQPCVPLLVLALLWHRRMEILRQYYELAFVFPEDSPKRRGKVWITVLGCLLMAGAAIVQMPGVQLFGLIVAIIGGVYYLFGPFLLRAVWQPLAFLLLMLPPPDGLWTRLTIFLQHGTGFLTTLLFQQVLKGTEFRNFTIRLPAHDVDVTPALSGITLLFATLVLTLWLSILRRVPVLTSLLLLVVGAFAAVIANALRLIALGLFTVDAPSPWIIEITTWLLVGASFFVVARVAERLIMKRPIDDLTGEEDDADADFDDILRAEREKLAGESEKPEKPGFSGGDR